MRYVPFLLISVIFSQDVTRVSEFKTSTFQGKECDDTEYRNEWGRPNWKNYGSWLSECDSLATTFIDAEFAIKRKKKQEEERLAREKILAEPLEELDLDAMWENTVWNEIQDIQEDVVYETEYITAVAGVRGAEAEDEALALLYYRRSMKGLSKLDLQKALGKLIIKREKITDEQDAKKIDKYIVQLKNKIKNT
tara:strand:- start:27 stop:608 length:582 start_codon:yes stop_codon:yes gene_type:complete